MTARVALITGAARRIGRSIALDLASVGYDIAVHYQRSHTEAQVLVDEIRALGRRAEAVRADLRNESEVATLIDQCVTALGSVDVLINNASMFERDEVATTTRASWDDHMEINLRAPFVLTQKFAQQLSDTREGVVVNILDQRVFCLTGHFISYTLSKAALWTLTQTLALALAPRVRVNAVGPGPVLPSTRQTHEEFVRQWSGLPLERQVQPEEIAHAVRYMVEAKSVTGQMLAVDGGQHLGWAHRARGSVEEE
jgi:NAD(P)-dependent dehydrogenase (short-subunit alcohol dehydrogenase family)